MTLKPDGICILEGCSNVLGPDCLEFHHKGIHVGGICEICLASDPSVRVLFVRDDKGILRPEEMISIKGR